jgi:rhamnose utilization protein RhaD (predicted bifunctional aldolase and dehydrogenase)
MFLVTPPNRPLELVRGVDLIELSHKRILELVQSDMGWEPEMQRALLEAKLRPTDPNPPGIVFLLAYLLSFEGIVAVAHTQPIAVNQILCSPRARQFADRRIMPEEILSCGPAAVLVPHCDTLLELARETRRKIALWKDRYQGTPNVILLTNNGMLALGSSVENVCRLTEMTVKAAETFVGAAMLGGPVFLSPGNVSKIEAWRS